MIQFQVDEGSVREVADHLEQTRLNILAAIRTGMREGMDGLAQTVAEKLDGDPIVSHTGEFRAAVLASPRILEKPGEYIKGEVSTTNGEWRNLGLWLEYGTKFPARATEKYPKQFLLGQFSASNPASIKTHGHGAFRIEPKPFFNPSFQRFYPTILDLIQERIAEAIDGAAAA